MQHDDAGTWKHKGHVALDHILAAAELAEHNPDVALQSQKIRQTIDRPRLSIDEHNARRVERRQS